jgi:hypothetical protein
LPGFRNSFGNVGLKSDLCVSFTSRSGWDRSESLYILSSSLRGGRLYSNARNEAMNSCSPASGTELRYGVEGAVLKVVRSLLADEGLGGIGGRGDLMNEYESD